MDPQPISRRTFLAGGAAIVATLASGLTPDAAFAASTKLTPLVLSSDLYPSPTPQRFVFALAKGPKYASGPRADIAFAAPERSRGVLYPTRLYKKGLPKGRGIYVVEVPFPEPGFWKAVVTSQGQRVPFTVQVKEAAEAPVVGAPAPRAASPTTTDPLGVNPICTRQPACPLHTVSLGDVIGQGKPVVALFATPARCQSLYCGPVLDELLDVMTPYQGRAVFVHVEIYRSNRGVDLAPTVAAWGLPSEPWLYTIDAAGTIVERLDGAIGQQEIVAALDRLTA